MHIADNEIVIQRQFKLYSSRINDLLHVFRKLFFINSFYSVVRHSVGEIRKKSTLKVGHCH